MGWLSAVALGCTLVLAVADQADVSELAATALEADPAGGVDFEAAYKSTQTHFKQVAGTLAGAAVIKTMRVSALPDCEAACRADDECESFQFDRAFGECKIMKTEMEKLEKATNAIEKKAAVQEAKKAEKVAGKMEAKQEEEKKEEKKAEEKIKKAPISKLAASPSARDIWRKAVRDNAMFKQKAAASLEKVKESKEKVKGTATVERVVKRHVQDASKVVAAKHKALSAAVLNMEEQMMIRENPEAKEVMLAKGAKQTAEMQYDKAVKEEHKAKQFGDKAAAMSADAKQADLKATQVMVDMKVKSEKARKHVKKATMAYKSAELQQKNALDLKKQMDAAKAKTYLKMRSQQKERDVKAQEAAKVVVTKMDEQAKNECEAAQERVMVVEAKLKQQLTDAVSAKEQAKGAADIKSMTEAEKASTKKQIESATKQLVDQAKKKVDEMAEEMMMSMSHEELLGEVGQDPKAAAETEKSAAAAELRMTQQSLASAQAKTQATLKQMDNLVNEAAKAKKKVLTSKGEDKKALLASIKELEKAMQGIKVEAQAAVQAEKKARQSNLEAQSKSAEAAARVDRAAAEQQKMKIKESLKAVLAKKQVLEAKREATTLAAQKEDAMVKRVKQKEEAMKKQTQAKIDKIVEQEWAKKKALLKLPKVNCEKPHKTEVEKLKDHINSLEREKAAMKLAPAKPSAGVSERLKSELENNIRQSMEAEFDQKLSASKSAMKADMEKQMDKEKAVLNKATKKAAEATEKVQEQLIDAKVKAMKAPK